METLLLTLQAHKLMRQHARALQCAHTRANTHARKHMAQVRVDTLDGGVELIVPPLTQQGDRLRVRNKGIFNPRRGIKGDHFVDIV